MFTALYQGLTSKLKMEEKCDFQVLLETIEITSRSIEMFVSQCDQVNESSDNDTEPAKTVENYLKLLFALDKYLNEMISLSMEDMFNNISWSQYSNEQINSKKYLLVKNKILNKINAMNCLFTWDLPISQKDIISHIKKKYCHFNLDISTPVFTFERYISNLIIAYELFLKGKEETAKIVILLIGKWLEELDNSADELYLSIRDGLKYVLTATFIHMKMKTVKTKMADHIKWFMNINMEYYLDMNDSSMAAVHAIKAAVLLEYSDSQDCFMEANECAKTACNLDPTCSYWFYLHSLVLTAQRRFLFTNKSYSGVKENKAIQQAIKLSVTENVYIKYHEMILLKDNVLYNFYSKNDSSLKHVSDCKKIISMIKTLVNIEPNDPLVVVNCARIFISLPDMIPDINYGKNLLLKGIQMAPNDLTVLKAITQALIVCKKKIFKCENSSIITYQSSSAHKQINLGIILKLAVEKHVKNENPVPYLLSLLKNNNKDMQWKILAQICSYVVLFQENVEDGVKYFKLLIEAVQKENKYNYLILNHSSLFTSKPKSFNLAELIRNEIKIALQDDILENKPYYYNVLTTILLIYCTDSKDNVDRSYRLNIIGEHRNENEQFDIQNVPQTLNKISKRKSRKRSRSRNHRNNRNNTNINSTENEVSYEDDSDDGNLTINDNRILTINDDNGTNDNCCRCMIM